MPEVTPELEQGLRRAVAEVEELNARILELHAASGYEDLEHGALALDIVHHTIEEVLEHTGLGGHIPGTADAEAHRQAESWRSDIGRVRSAANTLLSTHPNEDLETAIRALTIAEGSLEEVAERYE